MPRNYNLEAEHPHLSLEAIASQITTNRTHQDELCKRAKFHYENPICIGFRNSFKKRDGRTILFQWFTHWNKSLQSGKDYNGFWNKLAQLA